MRRALRSFVLALVLAPAFALPASADDGCGGSGRPTCTILRPPAAQARERSSGGWGQECIVVVGGLGSPTDGSDADFFDAVLGDLAHEPRFRMIRFGVDDGTYRTTGDLSRNGEELRSAIGRASDECEAVHVLAHSLGGVVADRALSKAARGVATYVALASPHNGANIARTIRPALEADELLAAAARLAARASGAHDPMSEAIRDLARTRAPRPVRAEAAIRLRLVTDAVVLRRDSIDRRVDVREYMPAGEIEGHAAIVRHPLAQDVVRGTIAARRAPEEVRSPDEVTTAALASVAIDDVLGAVEESARIGLLASALTLRSAPFATVANALAAVR